MRILITVSTYKPHTDGIQFVTSYLAEGLAEKGHQVDLIAYEYPNLTALKEEDINGVHVIRWKAKTVHMRHRGDKDGYQRYILENQMRYDVIVNVGTQTALTDWLFPIIGKIRVPMILHLHSIWDFAFCKTDFTSIKSAVSKLFGTARWGHYYFWNKKVFQQYDAVMQLHENDQAYAFFKKHYKIDSIILENAAEEAFFEGDTPEKKPILLYVANYGKMKNQMECIKVFEKCDLPDDWMLKFVGSKETAYYRELRDYCESRMVSQKRGKVELLVGLSREQVIQLIKESSIYLTTSLKEAFPISILEAMAAGIPFVSKDVGVVKCLPGGLIAHDQEEFVQMIEHLVSNDSYREELGELGRREACEKYRIAKKVAQLEHILEAVIAKHKA